MYSILSKVLSNPLNIFEKVSSVSLSPFTIFVLGLRLKSNLQRLLPLLPLALKEPPFRQYRPHTLHRCLEAVRPPIIASLVLAYVVASPGAQVL